MARVFALAGSRHCRSRYALEPAENGASPVDWINTYIGTGARIDSADDAVVTTPFG